MKGNRQGFLSRLITRRSGQNCKIILQILILQFCRQLAKKVQKDFLASCEKVRLFERTFSVLFVLVPIVGGRTFLLQPDAAEAYFSCAAMESRRIFSA